MPRTRHWRDPFTHQTHRAVPLRLADRLDTIAAAAAAHTTSNIESSDARAQLRTQLEHLLMVFAHRTAYRRAIDEIHAGQDGLLPVSSDRRGELRNHATAQAALRDLGVVWAVQDGASIQDAALAAGITLDDAHTAIAREQQRS